MNTRIALGAVTLVATLGLTRCGPTGEPAPSDTPSASPTASETPTPEPTETDEPAGEVYTAQQAYADCVELSNPSVGIAGPPTYAPFSEAYIVPRTDGLTYVYIEVTIPSAPTDPQKYIAAECILGPDTPDGNWLAGARTRAPIAELDANAPLPTED